MKDYLSKTVVGILEKSETMQMQWRYEEISLYFVFYIYGCYKPHNQFFSLKHYFTYLFKSSGSFFFLKKKPF